MGLERLYTALRDVQPDTSTDVTFGGYLDKFNAAMDDDLNMPEAYAVLFEVAKDLNKAKVDGQDAGKYAQVLVHLGGVLGVLQNDPVFYLQGDASDDVAEIEALIMKRNQARADKDWGAADAARDALKALNVELEDGPTGTTWRRL